MIYPDGIGFQCERCENELNCICAWILFMYVCCLWIEMKRDRTICSFWHSPLKHSFIRDILFQQKPMIDIFSLYTQKCSSSSVVLMFLLFFSMLCFSITFAFSMYLFSPSFLHFGFFGFEHWKEQQIIIPNTQNFKWTRKREREKKRRSNSTIAISK